MPDSPVMRGDVRAKQQRTIDRQLWFVSQAEIYRPLGRTHTEQRGYLARRKPSLAISASYTAGLCLLR